MADFEKILGSKTFRFLIGPQQEEYTLHSALLSQHSEPLNVLINGHMKEAREGEASLEDVDKQTFIRFCEYLYKGYYQPAEHTVILDESSVPWEDDEIQPQALSGADRSDRGPPRETGFPIFAVPERSTIEDDGSFGGLGMRSKKKSARPVDVEPAVSKRTLLWQKFSSQKYGAKVSFFEPRKNKEACEDYTEVFLSHAQVYVFAETYDVQGLRYLALQELQRTLAQFSLYEERTGDIYTLVRYVYEFTAERKGNPDELRSLVAHYVACNIAILSKDKSFSNLLKEGGSISCDYRMVNPEAGLMWTDFIELYLGSRGSLASELFYHLNAPYRYPRRTDRTAAWSSCLLVLFCLRNRPAEDTVIFRAINLCSSTKKVPQHGVVRPYICLSDFAYRIYSSVETQERPCLAGCVLC